MELPIFNSIKQASKLLMRNLDISKSNLAGMVGVSERTLDEWGKASIDDFASKSNRLIALYNVVRLIKKERPNISAKDCRCFLYNSRIVFDPEDEEEGSVSMISFILAHPEEKDWISAYNSALEEYEEFVK